MLTQSREVLVTEYFCSECDSWVRREQTWSCEGCGGRFCTEEDPAVITEDGILFCKTCVKRLNEGVHTSQPLYD